MGCSRAAVGFVLIGGTALRLHHPGGDERRAAALENYAGERARRRAVEHGAVGRGKSAAMAGAVEAIFCGGVEHGTGGVSAGAAEGDVGLFRGAQQDAGLDVGGVGENCRAADGNFSGLRDDACGIRLEPAAKE